MFQYTHSRGSATLSSIRTWRAISILVSTGTTRDSLRQFALRNNFNSRTSWCDATRQQNSLFSPFFQFTPLWGDLKIPMEKINVVSTHASRRNATIKNTCRRQCFNTRTPKGTTNSNTLYIGKGFQHTRPIRARPGETIA